jgi:hypothetical protein
MLLESDAFSFLDDAIGGHFKLFTKLLAYLVFF